MKRDKAFRIEQRERVIKNRKRLMKDTDLQHRNENQDNRYNKQHPYDCGNAACLVCHPEKAFDEKTVEDLRVEDSYKEQIRDELEGD
jgi:hypothetical protein